MNNVTTLAREAGIPTLLFPDGVEQLSAAHERFAALHRAQVLEEAAGVCEAKAREWIERSVPLLGYSGELEDCAAAIRALKQEKT